MNIYALTIKPPSGRRFTATARGEKELKNHVWTASLLRWKIKIKYVRTES